jgi:hypothetical protein
MVLRMPKDLVDVRRSIDEVRQCPFERLQQCRLELYDILCF